MKRYEYKQLFDRITVAMSAQDFNDWIFKKLNEWGAEGWHITQYNTPMAQMGGSLSRQQAFTGELVATGCRQITEAGAAAGVPFIGDITEPAEGGPLSVVEGLNAGN